ncbi:MAG: hypothetical protein KAS32_31575 [Candidatus Peribacteraceae bacterium]|nr:hypothetical protein [Candidatus Peribacteraceae bacterium]
MKWLRKRATHGEILAGTWLTLGSSITAEIAGHSGFDWCLLDLEHGLGGYSALLYQMQALVGTNTVPVIRITNNDPSLIKRALDIGAAGIMVPCVNTKEDAEQIVKAMKYPPEGFRGMDPGSRAALYGMDFDDYYPKGNRELLTIIQIESAEGVKNVDEIAALDGVDVLFVGHVDLSLDLGHFSQLDHPEVIEAERKVLEACKKHSKVAGLLLSQPENINQSINKGYNFIALSSDLGMIAKSMSEFVNYFKQ